MAATDRPGGERAFLSRLSLLLDAGPEAREAAADAAAPAKKRRVSIDRIVQSVCESAGAIPLADANANEESAAVHPWDYAQYLHRLRYAML